MSTSTMDQSAPIEALFEGFNRGDIDQAVAQVAPDFELLDVPVGMTFRGPDGLRQWFETWRMAAPNAQTEVLNMRVAGDWVFSEHIGRGVHTGPLQTPAGAIPPTERPFELRMAEVYEIKDGKITQMRAYWDSATLLRQLGIMG